MNKFREPFLAILATILIITLSIILANIFYRPKIAFKRGYEVEIVVKGNVEKKEEKPVDINILIKEANLDAGAKIFKKCATCHNLGKNAANKVGPNLYGVIGRKRASYAGFSYSKAMASKGGQWSIEDINQYLTNPKEFVPGNKMSFAGLKKIGDRANVIGYIANTSK
jgi:cytochrome c